MKIERKDGKLLVTVETKANVDDQRDLRQPFRNRFAGGSYTATLSETEDLTPAAAIRYTKRGGGVYVYSNNPEMLAPADVGQAILKSEGLTGEIFFTYEHSNHTGAPFFLGLLIVGGRKNA